MKKIKTRLIMIVVAGSLVCLNGCRNKEVPAEVAVESITSTENIAPVESITSTEGITPTGKTAEEETLTAPIPSEEAADTVSSETESAAQENRSFRPHFPWTLGLAAGQAHGIPSSH